MLTQKTKTILLVEDEAIIALVEAATIERFGYKVLTASSGEKAVHTMINRTDVDLVLMDINLGKGIDGTESARQILEIKKIPIVFMTSHSEREMVERVRGITRYGYVIKNSGDFVLQSSIEMAFELFDAHKRVSESELHLRTLVQTIPDLVWLKDADGIYLSCNPQFELFFGATETEIIGKTDYDFTKREVADLFREYDRKAMAADKPSVNEEWITFASDGHKALLETIKTPMKSSDGQLIGVLGISRDITERKRAEEKLSATLRQMYDIIDFLPDATFVIDQAGKVLAWNKAMEQLSGILKDSIIGQGDYIYSLPFYKERRPLLIDLIDLAGDKTEEKYEYIQRSGNKVIAETYIDHLNHGAGAFLWGVAAPLFDSAGNRIGAIEAIRDITNWKQAEVKIKATLQQMNDIIEFLPDPTYVLDKERKVVAWNKAMEQLTDVKKEEILGQGDYAYALPFYGERRPILIDSIGLPDAELASKYHNMRRAGNVVYAEVFAPHLKHGTGADLWLASTSLFDSAGISIGGIEVVRDISDWGKSSKLE